MEHGSEPKDNYYLPEAAWQKGRNIILAIGIVMWALSVIGAFANQKQFFFSYATAYFYLLMLTLGSLFFVKVQFLTGSAWSVTVRRIMENISVGIPWAALLFIPIALGLPYLYEWAHPEEVAHDPILSGRSTYFGTPFFFARVIIYFAIWTFFSLKLYKHSTRQDQSHSLDDHRATLKWSAPGVPLLFVTATLASFDWIMSLQPHWYSTIFGVYTLANGGLAFMAAVTLIAIGLRRAGYLTNSINFEHYHDLGKWMFAITIFWTYIAFSQYLLIWYANLPEETIFFHKRFHGSWINVSALLLIGHFIFPFLLLLNRGVKRNLTVLTIAACWLLFICYVDVYWIVMPNLHKEGLSIHWLDLTTLGAVASTFAFGFWSRMRKNAIIPVGDLRLDQCLAFKNQ